MSPEKIIILLLVIGFCSCSDLTVTSNSETKVVETNLSGLRIENGLRQGIPYIDSSGTEYIYYSITSTITNDSTIPLHLVVDLAKAKDITNDSLGTRVFLKPRKDLTQQPLQTFDKSAISLSISNDIEQVLALVARAPITLDTMLSPKDKCVMSFGLLNNIKHAEPSGIGLQVVSKGTSTAALGLRFTNINPEKHYLIPCGQIKFENVVANSHNL